MDDAFIRWRDDILPVLQAFCHGCEVDVRSNPWDNLAAIVRIGDLHVHVRTYGGWGGYLDVLQRIVCAHNAKCDAATAAERYEMNP